MTTLEDQHERKLVQAAQADPARFLELYDRCFHRDIEDVTSEVFRRPFENLSAYEWRGTPFAARLLLIVANTLANRWERASPESADPPLDAVEPDADIERRAMLFQLVDRLPEAQRRAHRPITGLNPRWPTDLPRPSRSVYARV